MPEHGVPEGAISREDIAELAALFDRFGQCGADSLNLSSHRSDINFGLSSPHSSQALLDHRKTMGDL